MMIGSFLQVYDPPAHCDTDSDCEKNNNRDWVQLINATIIYFDTKLTCMIGTKGKLELYITT